MFDPLLLLLDKMIRKAKVRRSRRHIRRRARSIGEGLRINGESKVNDNTVIGNNVHFNGMKILGSGRVRIGDNFHSGPGCEMITEIHNYDSGDRIPYDETYIPRDVVIESNVWLGSRVTILGGVTIHEGAVIQAESVVVSDIPYCAVAGGNPARVFKMRDVEHYETLRSQGRFK